MLISISIDLRFNKFLYGSIDGSIAVRNELFQKIAYILDEPKNREKKKNRRREEKTNKTLTLMCVLKSPVF